MAKQHSVKINHKVFTYYEEVEDEATGNTVRAERLAYRGQTVEVNDAAYERGQRLGAFVDPKAGSDEDTPAELDLSEASLDEVTAWIEEDKPNVRETVDASDNDPIVARKLLDAENAVTGNNPREGVLKGLTKVIEQGNE